ncbi:hypothetical protein QAD02_022756 [Eretmocerus hayati]|uniref:Uncharacterized protein n=1 Tax=Eretmocerus hayati TaxID=131215 RepID=A0ACC2PU49_9HYME|nr:hypothetical protein QAD02_022756 [Eretmocerus hayati]
MKAESLSDPEARIGWKHSKPKRQTSKGPAQPRRTSPEDEPDDDPPLQLLSNVTAGSPGRSSSQEQGEKEAQRRLEGEIANLWKEKETGSATRDLVQECVPALKRAR